MYEYMLLSTCMTRNRGRVISAFCSTFSLSVSSLAFFLSPSDETAGLALSECEIQGRETEIRDFHAREICL